MTKRIYIAAPFFTPQQLATVVSLEMLIDTMDLSYYSPRKDGVLQDMTPEEKAKNLERIFSLNVSNILSCEAVLAVLDEKDTGTTWEMGMAYGLNRKILGYTSKPEIKLNVMLRQCMMTHACGLGEARKMLNAFVNNTVWGVHQVGDTF